jgi:hypothetical protein
VSDLASTKPRETKVGGKAEVPCPRRMLQAIEGLVEPAHQLRVRRVNKAGRLRAVDRLGECAMEESVLNVELVHGPTLEIARVSTVRMVADLTTGLKVSS